MSLLCNPRELPIFRFRQDGRVKGIFANLLSQTSYTLQIIVTSTTAFLVAGRFGLAPTVKQQATPGLRLVDNGTKGLSTGDPAGKYGPCSKDGVSIAAGYQQEKDRTIYLIYCALPVCAGFTAVDVLGHGTMGHVIGVGAILSLRVSSLW